MGFHYLSFSCALPFSGPPQIRWNLFPLFSFFTPLPPWRLVGLYCCEAPAPGLEQVDPLPASWAQTRSIRVLALLVLVLGDGLIYPLMEFKYLSDGHSHAKWPIPEHLLHWAEALSTLPFTWVFPKLETS